MSPTEYPPTVLVFSKNNCSGCRSLKRTFIDRGVPFREINVEVETEPMDLLNGQVPLDYVVAHHGRQMPVVELRDDSWGTSFTGMRPDKIMEVVDIMKRTNQLIPESLRGKE